MSLFSTADSPNRFPCFIQHHLWREDLYQMVLRRPIETTALTVQVDFRRFDFSDYATGLSLAGLYIFHQIGVSSYHRGLRKDTLG
jgi:hypothetical protein